MQTISGKQLAAGGAVLALLIILPLVSSSFGQHVMIITFMFAMCGVAWNVMGGYAGMFSFGQVAFFGIGAYTSSFMVLTFHLSPWIGLVAGGVLSSLLAALIGYPCSKLRGHYFAIASIAFAEIVRIVFNNWKMVGAAEGLTLPMVKESLVHFMFHSSKLPYYYIMLLFLLIAVAVCYWVSTSKMGYYFRAIKESHEIAEVLGVNVVRYRLFAIMISAFLTSMAGTFYAQYILYIDPESVMILAISVQIVLVAMLGGANTVLGPVVGAAILIPLSEYSRAWLGYKGTGVDMILYGTLITVISMYQPAGVWGAITNLMRRGK
ncbi:MAG: branched-chain amino acid ABC transporter permease [Deltaproteobacteria bacterium]|nr:branched-chain amino acid ABC transporter permease [Deltaproteobacteria bacterium]